MSTNSSALSTEERDLVERSKKKVHTVDASSENIQEDEMEDNMQDTKGSEEGDEVRDNRPSYLHKLIGNRERKPHIKFEETNPPNLSKLKILEPIEQNPFDMIMLEDDYAKEVINEWNNAIILKLEGRSLNMNIFAVKVDNLWKLGGRFDIIDLGFGCYIMKLEDRSKMDNILTRGPWMVYNYYLGVRKWTPEFRASTDKTLTAITWARVPEVPVEYLKPDILYCIAKSIGILIKVDHNSFSALREKYARVCVQVDLDKPLKSLVGINGKKYNIEYENLPIICFECGRFGHRSPTCPTRSQEKSQRKGKEPAAVDGDVSGVAGDGDVNGGDKNQTPNSEPALYGDWMVVNIDKSKGRSGRGGNGRPNEKREGGGFPNNPFNSLVNEGDLNPKDTEHVVTKNGGNENLTLGPTNPRKRTYQKNTEKEGKIGQPKPAVKGKRDLWKQKSCSKNDPLANQNCQLVFKDGNRVCFEFGGPNKLAVDQQANPSRDPTSHTASSLNTYGRDESARIPNDSVIDAQMCDSGQHNTLISPNTDQQRVYSCGGGDTTECGAEHEFNGIRDVETTEPSFGADCAVSLLQSSFIPGRSTHDNVLVIQELIHSLRKSKGRVGGMVIKLDLEKAYDKPRVLWNGELLMPFVPSCGLRQGDPLSPYLFVLCVERLGYLVEHEVNEGK
ncbi:hypothetical protein BUALT_Bualt15G0100600 [Buddleja alternifolia]|uniref:CCHC-type domain-containing protein n=1 Tax=Buddleja alternifolia TaxID=168488 RepID=A0AAV6WJA9_9LAMI|nr:hypothetical protein BUALT_Bualt15G0100600 [Buddleja alternifolia]